MGLSEQWGGLVSAEGINLEGGWRLVDERSWGSRAGNCL